MSIDGLAALLAAADQFSATVCTVVAPLVGNYERALLAEQVDPATVAELVAEYHRVVLTLIVRPTP